MQGGRQWASNVRDGQTGRQESATGGRRDHGVRQRWESRERDRVSKAQITRQRGPQTESKTQGWKYSKVEICAGTVNWKRYRHTNLQNIEISQITGE